MMLDQPDAVNRLLLDFLRVNASTSR